MSFKDLIQIERVLEGTVKKGLGCDSCPLDKTKGVHKIFGKVKGKKIFIWAQSPGMQENRAQKELIGPSGKFLWSELKKIGITRHDCDIQNVVRCIPVDINKNIYPPMKMRSPSKEEVKCCSIYNEKALEKSKARIHLVFGQVAAQSLLAKEYNKTKRIFFSNRFKTWVVVLDHPSYFIRQGFYADTKMPPSESLKRFRKDLAHAVMLYKHKHYDQFQYLRDQNYIGVTDTNTARIAYRRLKRAAHKGVRIVVDMEEGNINHGDPSDEGKRVALCCGFTAKTGTSYTFALGHPHSGASTRCRHLNKKLVRRLLRDPNIQKSFHFGSSDTDAVRRLLNEKVRGYHYDTLIGEFFRDPNAKAYGLAAIANRRFPNFANYKEIRYPDAYTEDYAKKVANQKLDPSKKMEKADQTGKMNLARLPWKKMVLYNGADCHLQKLIDDSTVKHVNQPLMSVYVDSGHILNRMQHDTKCRPKFDYAWYNKIIPVMKSRIKRYKKQVRKLVGGKYIKFPKKQKDGSIKRIKTKFNPGSPGQIYWLLYDKLKYEKIEEHDDTRAGTIRLLATKHPKLACIYQLREAEKSLSMVESYKNCADLNNGDLATIWKSTGTSTGRISSGKTKERSDDHVINFQNVHGDHLIKCLFVPTTHWRKMYDYWLEHGPFDKHTWKKFKNIKVFMGLDFSQNELRQLAEESGDKNLIKMFSSGADPHVEVGHEITGWPKEQIANNDRVRKLVKNIQFGLVYGLQGEGLFRFVTQFGVKTTLKEINKLHAKYFKRFPGVKRMQEYYRAMVEKFGYVVNVFGFKRKLTNEDNAEGEGKFFGNIAINTPIQGAAHQLLLMAIASLHRKALKYYLLQNPWCEAHDSLFFTTILKHMLKAAKQGQELMTKEPVEIVTKEFKMKKRVPLKAKPKAGFRYGVMIEDVEGMTEYEFLNAWCKENKLLEKDLIKQAGELDLAVSV
jgi:uracil-DNA glycosylase family 4